MAATLTQLDAYLEAGKYAIVRTCPSWDPQDYIDRAAAADLTGLVFYLGTGDTQMRDADGPLTQWAPSSAGEEWQKLQFLLYSLGALPLFKAAGLSIGAFFDAGLGGWEAPAPEGFMYAAIMSNLGEDVGFAMVDVSHSRWARGTPDWHDDERDGYIGSTTHYAASKMVQLFQTLVWNITPKPRPAYVVTDEDFADYPHLGWDSPSSEPELAALVDFYTIPFCMLAPRIDPKGGEAAVVNKWGWNNACEPNALRRGEVVWDLRNTPPPNGAHVDTAMHLVTDDTLVISSTGCPGTAPYSFTPQCGVQVFDDLDKIEELGLEAQIAAGPALSDHWDMDGNGLWFRFQVHLERPLPFVETAPVPEAKVGQPYEVVMQFENWRDGNPPSWLFFSLVKCSCCEYGGGTYGLEGTWIRVNGADPDGWPVISVPADGRVVFTGIPTAADVGKWVFAFQVGIPWYHMRPMVINVAPAAVLPGQPMAMSAPAAADSDKERWPTPHLMKSYWVEAGRRQECMPGISAEGPPIVPPGPGDIGPGGPTTEFECDGATYELYNSILNQLWNAAGQTSDWEEMSFYIAVMIAESEGVANAAGDSCPNAALQCTKCITCVNSTLPTTCACSFGLYQLNVCGGQGETCAGSLSEADQCAYLLNPANNIVCAMVAMRDAWVGCVAAGCTGQSLYKCAAEMSGHPGGASYGSGTYPCGGSGGDGETARQRIAALTACVYYAGDPGFPLEEFYLSEPNSSSITANCQWHIDNESFPAVDYGCSTPDDIYASHTGTVVFAAMDPITVADSGLGKGNYVEIRDAANGSLHTRYAHLSVISVSEGDVVEQGDKVGECGETGYTFGQHLHFELLEDGVNICPCAYIEEGC